MSCPHKIELSRSVAVGGGRAYDEHLAGCPQCAAEVEQHRQLAALTRANLPLVVPDAETAQRARGALLTAAAAARRDHVPATSPWRRWLALGVPALALAAVLTFVLVGTLREDATYRGTVTASADGTTFRRTSGAPDEVVRLSSGVLTVRVSPLASGERFRVVTADGEVEVRGTEFEVEAVEDRLRSVRVIHGRVEVRAAGAAPQILVAGERWDLRLAAEDPAPAPGSVVAQAVAQPEAPPVAPADTQPVAPTVALADAQPVAPTVAEAVAPVAPTRTTVTTEEPTGPVVTGRTDAPSRPRGTPSSGSPSSGSPSSGSPSSGSSTPSPRPPTAPAISTGSATPPPVARRPIEVLLDQGWSALSAGDAAAAAEAFEAAAKSDPSDPLAEDAWFWNASALVRLKSADAIGALEKFIKRYAKSPRTGEARAMLGWLVLPSDVDRAEGLFQAAAGDRSATVRASAAKGLLAVERKRATP